MKHLNSFRLRILSAAMLICLTPIGQAACPDDGARPMNIGPHNPQTTFPLWVQDSEGLGLEICPGTDQLNCISVPPFTPANTPGLTQAQYDLSAQIGSGEEAFFASAEASIDLPGGLALLVSAVEAAFLPDFQDGNQFAFTRLRIRIDIPEDGTYVVTHPWGQISYDIVGAANNRDINDSFDIPFLADQVGYQGRLGPILTWDTFPDDLLLDQYGPPFTFDPPFGGSGPDGIPDYIGTLNFLNPLTGGPEHQVKGSPCGTNFFRIDGPNIGGPGINSVQTDLFTVTGKVFNGAVLPTPLAVDQATYSRATVGTVNVGRVNVFATAPTIADVSFTGGPNIPAGVQVMANDGSNRHFGTVALTPDGDTVPSSVDVTADNNANPVNTPTVTNVPLVDLVTVTRAEYDFATGVLTIEAHSSDLVASPTLSALGQNLINGVLTTTLNPGVAPPTVTVTSLAGGSATLPVTIIHAAP
ncbi:MAG: hypothetical protein WBQ78_01030 [Gammaproteobacteria bacterium]